MPVSASESAGEFPLLIVVPGPASEPMRVTAHRVPPVNGTIILADGRRAKVAAVEWVVIDGARLVPQVKVVVPGPVLGPAIGPAGPRMGPPSGPRGGTPLNRRRGP